MTLTEVRQKVQELGPWFHDLEIQGVRTAPDHPLGSFLRDLWQQVEPAFPADMTGKTVLDIGCNAGFYSLQLHARGAEVLGVDHDARYLAQARFAAEALGAEIEFRQMDVYELPTLGRRFDFVLFMGVLYHLRHPLLALDIVAKLPRERLIVQSMLRGSEQGIPVAADYPITETRIFEDARFPAMYFLEHEYAGDWTNWWVPNNPCLEAMLRSAGLTIEEHVGREVYICAPPKPGAGFAVPSIAAMGGRTAP